MKAENLRIRMETTIEPVQKALEELLEDSQAYLVPQASDGWVVHWGRGMNSKINDLDDLLKMSMEEAYECLEYFSI